MPTLALIWAVPGRFVALFRPTSKPLVGVMTRAGGDARPASEEGLAVGAFGPQTNIAIHAQLPSFL
jgi:hypothetical protein